MPKTSENILLKDGWVLRSIMTMDELVEPFQFATRNKYFLSYQPHRKRCSASLEFSRDTSLESLDIREPSWINLDSG
jgi:hypothetical protein